MFFANRQAGPLRVAAFLALAGLAGPALAQALAAAGRAYHGLPAGETPEKPA